MKIKLSNDDIKLLRTALNYVVLSLNGNLEDIDNSQMNVVDMLKTAGECDHLAQLLGWKIDTK